MNFIKQNTNNIIVVISALAVFTVLPFIFNQREWLNYAFIIVLLLLVNQYNISYKVNLFVSILGILLAGIIEGTGLVVFSMLISSSAFVVFIFSIVQLLITNE